MNALLAFWRATLTRRIFGWFGAAILTTIAVMGVVMAIVYATGQTYWQQESSRIETLIGHDFAAVWNDHEARVIKAEMVSRDLHIQVELDDASGRTFFSRGPECFRHPHTIPVKTLDGEQMGTVRVCSNRAVKGGPLHLVLMVSLLFGVLWIASFLVARSLAFPLRELAEVAGKMGEGDLSARAQGIERESIEFRKLATALHEMAARIDGQLHDQRTLMAGVSHELRTPLGHLRLLIEIMRDAGTTPERLDEIEREIVDMDDLVDQLLATSRLDLDVKQTRTLRGTDVALEALERCGMDPTLLEVKGSGAFEGDPTLISRALTNLLGNAVKHAGDVSRFLVERQGPGLAFIVEDRGSGLPESERQRLFEPFVRASAVRASGLGLGLYLVRQIAAAHDGAVIVEENPGGGARIGFVVPLNFGS